MKRSEAQLKVTEIKDLFIAADLINRDVHIAFDRHQDVTIIEDIFLDKVTGFKLPLPDRFKDGKKYTPAIFTLKCLTSKLTFILEDVTTFIIMNGIRLRIGDRAIEVRKA